MQKKNKGGRPPRTPNPGERFQISFRVTPELKRKLDEATEISGRSQSQEAEFRLERSFFTGSILSEALSLAFGPRAAGLLLALGEELSLGGRVSTINDDGIPLPIDAWFDNASAYALACFHAVRMLILFRPGAEIVPDEQLEQMAHSIVVLMKNRVPVAKMAQHNRFRAEAGALVGDERAALADQRADSREENLIYHRVVQPLFFSRLGRIDPAFADLHAWARDFINKIPEPASFEKMKARLEQREAAEAALSEEERLIRIRLFQKLQQTMLEVIAAEKELEGQALADIKKVVERAAKQTMAELERPNIPIRIEEDAPAPAASPPSTDAD